MTLAIFGFLLMCWLPDAQQDLSAQKIIDRCIEAHGGKSYRKCSFTYDFRDKSYAYTYNRGKFEYRRSFTDKEGQNIEDILTNSSFTRKINGQEVKLDPKKKSSYSNSVNSVHYFAFLPFFLNDPAVNKELLGQTTIGGEPYFKIRVTFNQEGGGDDFEDIHMYWIHSEKFTMDYLGYSFHVNSGGVRFRKAYNPRKVGGIRFQDYINYKHEKTTPVEEMDQLFVDGKLEELSVIELKNINVK